MDNYLLNEVKEVGIVKIINGYVEDLTNEENRLRKEKEWKHIHWKIPRAVQQRNLNIMLKKYSFLYELVNH